MDRRQLQFANGGVRRCATLLATVGSLSLAVTAGAQTLSPKRTLTTGAAPGCEIVSASQGAVARRDNVEARRLAAAGQESALVGDQSAARDAFARAAVLNPGDERVAYDLARAHEELADTTKAVSEFCRYLTLSPAGREATDVRDRLLRLVPRQAVQRAADVQVAFRLGLALFDDGGYEASARAFDDVVKNAPTAPEGVYNRGLARAAAGRRADAISDLELFRAAAASVDDRVAVGRAIETLRRPVYSRGKAFTLGLVPSFGQFYTGRPVRGVIVLLAVAGSAGAAFAERTTETQVAYVDPNGVPAPYIRTTTERPYLTAGAAAAGGLTLIAMIESVVYAYRSQRGASIVARRGATTSAGAAASSSDAALAIVPTVDRFGRAGLRLSARF